MDLETLQDEHREWVEKNFPNQRPWEPLLGVAEEVGELSHAHLKGHQGIRHSEEEIKDLKYDAIGDIVIYLASYCNANHMDLSYAVSTAWETVKRRDWQANPEKGAPA